MSIGVHSNTPGLTVLDGRTAPVRRVNYLRSSTNEQAQRLVTAQMYDVAGRIIAQWDPRLQVGPTANLRSVYSLSGTPLRTENVDGGLRRELLGLAGQTVRSWNGRGSQQQTVYDMQLRPTLIREQNEGLAWTTVRHLRYGDNSTATHNQCGRLVDHYDTAGYVIVDDYSMTGTPLQLGQRFLYTLELPDWPDDVAERDRMLEPTRYETRWRYNAMGQTLSQTDAKGHTQHIDFDLAGQPKAVHLQWAAAPAPQVIAQQLQYTAAGKVQTYTAGNGVMTTCTYDPIDGRLSELKAIKGSEVHQSFSYRYDPAGNVTSITDHTHVTRYHANQRIEGVRTFTYDSLYRLESATGLEVAGAGIQPGLPGMIPPADLSLRTPYTQRYEYDWGGNLQKLTHGSATPGQAHTLHLTMAPSSNRCINWRKGENFRGDDLDFDASGNQLTLPSAGQSLTWNARNQLHSVTQVQRQNAADDAEYYAYDAQGNRQRKRQTTQAASVTHVRDVRYLPGLEIRTLDDSEELHVCTVNGLGFSVRGLHWVKGRPDEIEQGQLRYSLEDHLGCVVRELDQDARLISHEGYYPFGGTAWWAAASDVQASYKTVRYSGKERDASGLYYYGFRYYAPWMMRWINPDPAGPVDGLNLYAMVGNNPMRYSDPLGLQKNDGRNNGDGLRELMNRRTTLILKGGETPLPAFSGSNAKQMKLRQEHFAKHPEAALFLKKNRDDALVAHAGFEIPGTTPDETVRLTDFFNIPLPDQLDLQTHGVTEFRSASQDMERGDPVAGGIFKFGDVDRYLAFAQKKIIETFNDPQQPIKVYKAPDAAPINLAGLEYETPALQPLLNNRLKAHIVGGHQYLPKSAGLPGLHAEAIGAHVALSFQQTMTGQTDPSQILVVTQKLKGAKTASDFPACFSCANILMPQGDNVPFNVLTGRTDMTHEQWNIAARRYI